MAQGRRLNVFLRLGFWSSPRSTKRSCGLRNVAPLAFRARPRLYVVGAPFVTSCRRLCSRSHGPPLVCAKGAQSVLCPSWAAFCQVGLLLNSTHPPCPGWCPVCSQYLPSMSSLVLSMLTVLTQHVLAAVSMFAVLTQHVLAGAEYARSTHPACPRWC